MTRNIPVERDHEIKILTDEIAQLTERLTRLEQINDALILDNVNLQRKLEQENENDQ